MTPCVIHVFANTPGLLTCARNCSTIKAITVSFKIHSIITRDLLSIWVSNSLPLTPFLLYRLLLFFSSVYLEFLLDRLSENETETKLVLEKVSQYCMFPVTHPDSDEYETPYIWTFYHSFYFVFTVVSTVGYGNISPNSTFGRMFMILYAIIGLPLNAIMFANLGDIFGTTVSTGKFTGINEMLREFLLAFQFDKLYRRYKNYKMSMNKNYVALRLSLIAQVFLYLVPGILIFIFLPACVFTYFEKWPYEVSVYYSFVTLTTIGFGDYASSFQPWQPREFGNLFVAYEAFIIIWFILGLGYLVMIMGYLIK